MTDNRPLRLDAIIRVSRRGGRADRDLRSPDQQREIIEREAARLGARLHWHEDAIDVSGKTMDRDDIALVLARLRTRETDGLIVAFASRLSRSRVDEALSFKTAVDELGGRLVIGDMAGIDIDTAAGELMFTTMLGIARFQWRQAAEGWDRSRRGAVKAGKAIGGAPFGYRYRNPSPRPDGRGGIVDSRLVPDEDAAPIVRELFERKAAGATWLELARWLDGAAPRPTGARWARSSVIAIVRRDAYLGVIRHGEHVQAAAHEPLVSPALWRRAQNKPGHRTPRGTYLLTGLVHCEACGARMRGTSAGRRGYRIFHCDNPDCVARSSVMAHRLDHEVVRRLAWRLDEDATLSSVDVDAPDAEGARRDLSRLESELDALARVAPRHPVAVAAHQEALESLERELEATEESLRRALAASHSEQSESVVARHEWDELNLGEQREIIRAALRGVRVRRSIGKGPNSDITARVEVDFAENLTRSVGAAYARVIGARTGETWIARPSAPIDDATRRLLTTA